jgi:hypothetical protein
MYRVLIFVLIACVALEVSAQTFQYSRGWTNGKRSGDMPLKQMMPNPMLTANDLNSRER